MSTQYAPPPTTSQSGPRAGFWIRVGQYLIDGILLFAGSYAFAYAVGQQNHTKSSIGFQLHGGPALILLVVIAAYYTLLEGGKRGQTVGMMATGIRVYDLRQGGPIGYGRALVRFFGRLLATIPCLLGYFWMLWDKEKQGWHDKLANSIVVPVAQYPIN